MFFRMSVMVYQIARRYQVGIREMLGPNPGRGSGHFRGFPQSLYGNAVTTSFQIVSIHSSAIIQSPDAI
jgi:hypothetical protein